MRATSEVVVVKEKGKKEKVSPSNSLSQNERVRNPSTPQLSVLPHTNQERREKKLPSS